MSDYLHNLVARTLHLAPVVQARLPSLFEPSSVAAGHAVNNSAPPEAIHENQKSTPTISKVFRALPLENPFSQQPEPAEFEDGRRPASPRMMQSESGRQLETPPREISQFGELIPREGQILTPFPSHAVASQTTKPEAHQILSRNAEGVPGRSSENPARASVSKPEVSESLERSMVESRLVVADHLPREPSVPGDRDLVETTALRALAARVVRSAQRQESAGVVSRPNAVSQFPAPEAPTTITVTIGRVDVRAVFPQPPPPPARRVQPTPMSLDEYFKQQGEGRK